jgi:hypothetical protein
MKHAKHSLMEMNSTHVIVPLAFVAVCAGAGEDRSAERYSLRPAHFLVAFPPGGSADATARVVGQPATRSRRVAQGFDVIGNSLAEFGAFIRDELARWSRTVTKSGARIV